MNVSALLRQPAPKNINDKLKLYNCPVLVRYVLVTSSGLAQYVNGPQCMHSQTSPLFHSRALPLAWFQM